MEEQVRGDDGIKEQVFSDDAMKEQVRREQIIIRTSLTGIIANAFLAGLKAVVGLTSNSIAIVMDAVNNLSDAASSVITIVGTKLAGKEADRKHPFGYGRIEYLSAMVISLLVLYAGITALIESMKKIIWPDTPDYGKITLLIVAAAVVVKLILGKYVKAVGEKVRSDSLVNSGADAMLDSVISASTLAAAVIYLLFNVSTEAWLGVIIAVVIIKSGLEMLGDTLSKILGERVDAGLTSKIKATINSFAEVSGAYDLILHNYGPDTYHGSVHIEVPDTMSAGELDKLIRRIQVKVYREHGIILTAIGIYSNNTTDSVAAAAREQVKKLVTEEPDILQMHGFYIDREEKTMRFDVVVSFTAEDRRALYGSITDKIKKAFPGYRLEIAMDTDFSEGN